MARPHPSWTIFKLALALACALAARLAFAQASAAQVEFVEGPVSIVSPDGRQREPHVNDQILEGETVVTGAGAELHALTADHGYLAFRPDTRATIVQLKADGDDQDSFALSLLKGSLRSITGWIGKKHPQHYAINTPTATIGIRGTDHETSYVPPEERRQGVEAGTYDKVNTGTTVLRNAVGELVVNAGESAFTPHENNVAPVKLARHPPLHQPSPNESRIDERKEVVESRYEERLEQRRKEVQERREQSDKRPNQESSEKTKGATAPEIKPAAPAQRPEHEQPPHRPERHRPLSR